MEFLCVSGVVYKLQIHVTDSIDSLRNRGIQIWMLTGDKVETETCIAISYDLKSKNQKTFYIKNILDDKIINSLLVLFFFSYVLMKLMHLDKFYSIFQSHHLIIISDI